MEIKFRAWDKETETMIYSENGEEDCLDYDFKCDEFGNLVCFARRDYDEFEKWVKLDNIMPYAGLKDKNGKEIYEGDIIKCKRHYGEDFIGVLRYNKEYMLYEVYNKVKDEAVNLFTLGVELKDWEIIGNIHDNPELLGDQNG